MKCIHKNDGENKIETNFEVYCDEKLLIKSDSVYFLLSQTWCGMLLLAGRLQPDHLITILHLVMHSVWGTEWIKLSDKDAPRVTELTAAVSARLILRFRLRVTCCTHDRSSTLNLFVIFKLCYPQLACI